MVNVASQRHTSEDQSAWHRVSNTDSQNNSWYESWATAIDAILIGDHHDFEDFLGKEDKPVDAFMQFTTPKRNVTLCIERVLSKPLVLLYRALKMNDYELSEKILAYFHFPDN